MPASINPLVQRLWDLGHFFNPAHPTGVVESDLPSLQLHDKSVRIALASFQEFMAADFDRLSNDEHGRIGVADGDIGPATIKLFEVERCGHPDYTIEQANGSGSWPSGCHPEYPNNHAFAIYFDHAGMPSHWREVFDESWLLCRQTYANIGLAMFETKVKSKANTIVTWQRSRTWIGLAVVPSSPRCGEQIWAKFDNSYASSYERTVRKYQLSKLKMHEFGHNMGMSHSRGGVMNPSITSGVVRPDEWRGDPSESILRRYFGGVPVDIGGTPPTDPVPVPPSDGDCDKVDLTKLMFQGSFTLSDENLNQLREFILIPKPKV